MTSPAIVVALIGVAVTILLAVISGAVVAGRILSQVASHGRALNNGLSSQVRENARAIAELSKTQAVVIEHQRGQDQRLDALLGELHCLSQGIRSLNCLRGAARCRPAQIPQRED